MKKETKKSGGPERFSDFLKVTQLVGGGGGFRIWMRQLDSRDDPDPHTAPNVAQGRSGPTRVPVGCSRLTLQLLSVLRPVSFPLVLAALNFMPYAPCLPMVPSMFALASGVEYNHRWPGCVVLFWAESG